MGIGFKRVTTTFDETARARLCQSSGSEHSSEENSAELSDLINSFIEKDERMFLEEEIIDMEKDGSDSETISYSCSSAGAETSKERMNLLLLGNSHDGDVRMRIRSETELALKDIAAARMMSFSDQGVNINKRHLMSRLRERGFDAGFCKSRWKKIGQFPGGDYEYIDVMVEGTRYIVEANLTGEFTIARPSNQYQSLLDAFPPVFVAQPDDLKQVVKLMCSAVKKSMKNGDMHVPPWRRNGFMLAKWFSSYKRTMNTVPRANVTDSDNGFAKKRSVGFESAPVLQYYCRSRLGSKVNLRVGNLTQMLDADDICK
ncbi:hypothetical protein IFM89_016119 [Coptis chinensis]|uniref:DUF506 family protein n=1 Tax=Coptis chinensis TaxID=261450 RepID=A0A835GZJ1_9MAGN|nr:hypothetical protein IFM89_016119 [Coptis chinensis]